MLEHLVVRLSNIPGNASWAVLDSVGQRLSPVAHGSLGEAAGEAENRRVLLLVPGLDAVCGQSSLPVKSAARRRQMLPYSLEDTVAEDVDHLHFAIGAKDPSGRTPVTMVSHRRMESWLADCERAGLNPERVYCESDGVPSIPGRIVLVTETDCTYGRVPGQPPFALQGMSLEEILRVAHGGEKETAEMTHVMLFADTGGYARCENEIGQLRERGIHIEAQLLREGILPRLGATLIDLPGCNLFQGIYGQKTDWQSRLRPWRFAAVLLLGLFALAISGEGARHLALDRDDRNVTAMLETACRLNAGTGDISSCQAEVRSRLVPTVNKPETDFLAALDRIAQAWNEDSRLEALSFRTGIMDFQVLAGSVSTLDEFAREISDKGSFRASIQSANPTQDGILGRLQVTADPQ